MMRPAVLFALALAVAGSVAAEAQESKPISQLPFSAARQAGNTLYISGQIPRTADGADVRESVAAETRQVMENTGRILKANGYSFSDVVMANVYLSDIDDYHQMNAEYASFFEDTFPARACVGGQEIVFGFRVEISCIAHKDKCKGCPAQGKTCCVESGKCPGHAGAGCCPTHGKTCDVERGHGDKPSDAHGDDDDDGDDEHGN